MCAILSALDVFPHHVVLQSKGLVLLGVMVEGAEPLQEAVRQRMVEERAINRCGRLWGRNVGGNVGTKWRVSIWRE